MVGQRLMTTLGDVHITSRRTGAPYLMAKAATALA
jgi:hypothetical protein